MVAKTKAASPSIAKQLLKVFISKLGCCPLESVLDLLHEEMMNMTLSPHPEQDCLWNFMALDTDTRSEEKAQECSKQTKTKTKKKKQKQKEKEKEKEKKQEEEKEEGRRRRRVPKGSLTLLQLPLLCLCFSFSRRRWLPAPTGIWRGRCEGTGAAPRAAGVAIEITYMAVTMLNSFHKVE